MFRLIPLFFIALIVVPTGTAWAIDQITATAALAVDNAPAGDNPVNAVAEMSVEELTDALADDNFDVRQAAEARLIKGFESIITAIASDSEIAAEDIGAHFVMTDEVLRFLKRSKAFLQQPKPDLEFQIRMKRIVSKSTVTPYFIDGAETWSTKSVGKAARDRLAQILLNSKNFRPTLDMMVAYAGPLVDALNKKFADGKKAYTPAADYFKSFGFELHSQPRPDVDPGKGQTVRMTLKHTSTGHYCFLEWNTFFDDKRSFKVNFVWVYTLPLTDLLVPNELFVLWVGLDAMPVSALSTTFTPIEFLFYFDLDGKPKDVSDVVYSITAGTQKRDVRLSMLSEHYSVKDSLKQGLSGIVEGLGSKQFLDLAALLFDSW